MSNTLPTRLPHWADMMTDQSLTQAASSVLKNPSVVPLAVWDPNLEANQQLRWATACLSWSGEARARVAAERCVSLAERAVEKGTVKSTPGPWGLWTVTAYPLACTAMGPQALIVLLPRPGGDPVNVVLTDTSLSGATTQWRRASDQAGLVSGAMAEVAHQVLAQRQAEELLSRRAPPQRPLSPQDEGRKALLASLNHEVRAPLATLQGVASTLRDDPDMPLEDRSDFLEVMEREARRVAVLVDDLLLFTRLETIHVAPETQLMDLRLCVAEVAGELLSDFERAGVTLRVPPPEQPIEAAVNVPLFHQMTRCLLGHALKFTPTGGTVELDWLAQEGQWSMVVQDDGIPLPADELNDAFERFYGSRRAARTCAMAGLGLVLVRRIATAQGWAVSIAATHGAGVEGADGGTRVSVTVPAAV